MPLRIFSPVTIRDGERIRLECRFDGSQGEGTLWYSVEQVHGDIFSTATADAFVLPLLPLAMATGQMMQVDGPMSERLFYTLNSHIMPLLQRANSVFRPVTIEATSLLVAGKAATGVATGFSAGVDSFFTFLNHCPGRSGVPRGHQLTHLVFNNVGAHGASAEARDLFWKRFTTIRGFATEGGLPLISVDSNLAEADYGTWLLTHSLRNAGVAHALSGGLGRFYYSSGISYADVCHEPVHDIAFLDPLLVPQLSSDFVDCISYGCQTTRVVKTAQVAAYEPATRWLNVCLDTARNCSRCSKCLRTLVTLEVLGSLGKFDKVFDLATYQQHRAATISLLFSKPGDPLLREIVQHAERIGYQWPRSLVAWGKAKALAKRALGRL